MRGKVCKVALQGATLAFDKLYTYALPPELSFKAKEGCRVLVPFGRGNTKKQGIIFEIFEDELKGLKKLSSLIDNEPVLTAEMIKMCEYLHETVFCTYYDAVSAMLPVGLSYSLVNFYSVNSEFSGMEILSESEREVLNHLKTTGEKSETAIIGDLGISAELLKAMVEKEAILSNSNPKRKIGDATQKWIKLACEEPFPVKITPRQREVTDLLSTVGTASVKEICYFTGVTVSVIENLIKKGILLCYEKQVFRTPYKSNQSGIKEDIILTDEQQKAYDGLMKDYNEGFSSVSLLYGITGSGKTQVYLKLVDSVTEKGRGVIVMVPEISLTPQLISLFTKRYGNKIAVFHSAMSMGQRMDEWQRIKSGKAQIAIGTRSAIFAPFDNLGLIIIDEEQEHTYKSEKSPRFHTRELAKFRTLYHKGLLCLASATPSVESFTMAKKGKYSFYRLSNRYGNAILPRVDTVDMRLELSRGNTGVVSNELYEAIKETVDNGNQAIILLNRRGHNTYISCPQCGYVASCPSCSVSLTYHSANDRLMCHYCGHSVKAERICPECGCKHMKYSGLGTQKAEEEVKALFPSARVLRLDADSTASRDSYANYLTAFENGEYDILLGTQMVAKGLNFPKVTLVGVLGADKAMYSEDFRSFERCFSLLTQVVGRAGRGDIKGRAIIQTLDPESNVIELATRQDYDSFYDEEILTRKLMIYPPYCDICVVNTQSIIKNYAENAVKDIFLNIKKLTENSFKAVKLIILGPSPATVPRVNGKYRYRMIIKCKNNKEFRSMLRQAIDIKLNEQTSVSVDINPETII